MKKHAIAFMIASTGVSAAMYFPHPLSIFVLIVLGVLESSGVLDGYSCADMPKSMAAHHARRGGDSRDDSQDEFRA